MQPTVIYIISDKRSGSTLLESILEKSPECLTVGELRLLDDYVNKGKKGRFLDWKCSCGHDFKCCSFWSEILVLLEKRGIEEITNTRIHFKWTWKQLTRKFSAVWEGDENYKTLDLLENIYNAIFKLNSERFIIDSSKHPLQGLWLYKKLNYRVKVIHIKRDLRAVAISKQKWRLKFGKKYKNILSVLFSCKVEDIKCNQILNTIESQDKITIYYKNLAEHPQKILNLICQKFDLKSYEVPMKMDLSDAHSVAGTPNRRKKRPIKYDSHWKQQARKMPLFNFIGCLFNPVKNE